MEGFLTQREVTLCENQKKNNYHNCFDRIRVAKKLEFDYFVKETRIFKQNN